MTNCCFKISLFLTFTVGAFICFLFGIIITHFITEKHKYDIIEWCYSFGIGIVLYCIFLCLFKGYIDKWNRNLTKVHPV